MGRCLIKGLEIKVPALPSLIVLLCLRNKQGRLSTRNIRGREVSKPPVFLSGKWLNPSVTFLTLSWENKDAPEGRPYLDHREHSLVGLWVGVDLEALPRIPIDDGVCGPPGSCCRVIFVFHCQVDNDSHGSLLHRGLKLWTKQVLIVSALKHI